MSSFFFFLSAISLSIFGIIFFPLMAFLWYERLRGKAHPKTAHEGKKYPELNWIGALLLGSVSLGMILCLCSLSLPAVAGTYLTFPTVMALVKEENETVLYKEESSISNRLNKSTAAENKTDERDRRASYTPNPFEKATLIPALPSTSQPLTITSTPYSTITKTPQQGKQIAPTVITQPLLASKTPQSNNGDELQKTRGAPEAEFEGIPPPPDELLPEPDEAWEELP